MPAKRRVHIRGVYEIICTRTGRRYIGCSQDVEMRWRTHVQDLTNGRHACPELQQAWRQFGPNAFRYQVLQQIPSEEPLKPYENLWMAQYAGRLFNAMPENHHGLASRNKLSASQIATWVQRYADGNASVSLSLREEIARATRAWTRRPGVKQRMSRIAIESNAARFMRTPEAIARNAAALRGVRKSDAHRVAMSIRHSSGTCKCHPKKIDG